MSHSYTRLVAMLFAGLLVSSLLVAPVVAGAADRDDHEPTANGIDDLSEDRAGFTASWVAKMRAGDAGEAGIDRDANDVETEEVPGR